MSFCRFKSTSGTLVNLTLEFYGSCVFLSIGGGIKWSSLKGKEQLGKTFQKRSINCVLVFLYKLFILNHLLHSRQRQPNMESNYRWTGDPHRVVRIWRPDCDLLEIRGVPESVPTLSQPWSKGFSKDTENVWIWGRFSLFSLTFGVWVARLFVCYFGYFTQYFICLLLWSFLVVYYWIIWRVLCSLFNRFYNSFRLFYFHLTWEIPID